ncbi:MAG: hypothetical protein IIA06_10030 [Proteobacteria bacterium]|nr:hypothetical protein [Pseudomonadota bacterium]
MLLTKKQKRKIDDVMNQAFFGLIRISSAIDNIYEYVLQTIDEADIQKYKDDCENHFKTYIGKNIFNIYSPKTRFKIGYDFVKGIENVPTDWKNHYMDIYAYNHQLDILKISNIVPMIISIEEQKKIRKANPYKFSDLQKWLALETWKPSDGLLIINNIDPTGAEVNWEGFENYMGVHIQGVKLANAAFFDDDWDYYDLLHYIDEDEAKNVFKYDDDKIEMLANRREKILIYSGKLNSTKTLWDASNYKEERYSIKHYIDWAHSKNISIPWLDWAMDKELIAQSRTTKTETPEERCERLRKRKLDLIAQGNKSFIKTIAVEEGLSESRIKQLIKGS